MAHLFIVVVYDSFNRNNVKISKTYNFPDFSFFMSQDDAHYQNHRNAPAGSTRIDLQGLSERMAKVKRFL